MKDKIVRWLNRVQAWRQRKLFVTPAEARSLCLTAQRATLAQMVNVKLKGGSQGYVVTVTVPRHALETDMRLAQACNAIGFEVAAQLMKRYSK